MKEESFPGARSEEENSMWQRHREMISRMAEAKEEYERLTLELQRTEGEAAKANIQKKVEQALNDADSWQRVADELKGQIFELFP